MPDQVFIISSERGFLLTFSIYTRLPEAMLAQERGPLKRDSVRFIPTSCLCLLSAEACIGSEKVEKEHSRKRQIVR